MHPETEQHRRAAEVVRRWLQTTEAQEKAAEKERKVKEDEQAAAEERAKAEGEGEKGNEDERVGHDDGEDSEEEEVAPLRKHAQSESVQAHGLSQPMVG
jgi:phosphopantothenoylcysteine synthetase/decarboxylase